MPLLLVCVFFPIVLWDLSSHYDSWHDRFPSLVTSELSQTPSPKNPALASWTHLPIFLVALNHLVLLRPSLQADAQSSQT